MNGNDQRLDLSDYPKREISHEEAGADYAVDTVSSLKDKIEKLQAINKKQKIALEALGINLKQ